MVKISNIYLTKVIKAMLVLFVEKAKPIGTISQRKDGKYKKVAPNEWIKIKDAKGETEEKEEPTQPEQAESKFPDYTYDSEYNKLADKALSKVNDQSLHALTRYMESSFELNRQLRRGSDVGADKDIALIDKAFEEAPINGMNVPTLFRGALLDKSMIEQMDAGSIFTDKGFVSTSSNQVVAEDFSLHQMSIEENEIPVLFKILNGNGQFKALPVANLDEDFADQMEFVLNRDMKYEVISKDQDEEFANISIIVRN